MYSEKDEHECVKKLSAALIVYECEKKSPMRELFLLFLLH